MKNILLVDAGNSRLKWARLNSSLNKGQELSAQKAVLYGKLTPYECFVRLIESENKEKPDLIILVSVQGAKFVEQAENFATKASLDFINITSLQQLGEFKNGYANPEQLGADRFVAMVAACHLAKNKPCIVIDCGTAVTIDAIDAGGQHQGGLILPGLTVCTKSLLKGTQQLQIDPLKGNKMDLLANNTSQAILGGSFYGLSGAINEICFKIEQKMTGSLVASTTMIKMVCGGDAETLLTQLPSDFQSKPELVMQGLKIIAEQYLHIWHKESKK